tara:strand:+ start:129 stop:542 length:414 start_codon:yes stop_codon:yes gene_type:complete
MTEKKRRGRPRKQPIDDLGYITVNDRKIALGVTAGNNVTTGNDNVEIGNLPVDKSDGSTASYYELPEGAVELQDLISYKNMNAQIGEIFRSCYRFGQASHSDKLRDAKKIKFYILAEIKRLEAMLEKLNEERGRKGV